MKNNRFSLVAVAALIFIVGIIIVIIAVNSSKGDNLIDSQEDVVDTLVDGTLVVSTGKINETKNVGNFEISNGQITNKDGVTTFLADVKNIGEGTINNTEIQLIYLDENGKVLSFTDGLITQIEPEEATQLMVETTEDYKKIADYVIKIK